ncbi:MAG: ATP-binding protein [Gemmatimonadaceae bacterium]
MSDELIRVLLADDHAVVRAGLKAVVGNARDMLVVGEAATGREAVTMAERLKPTVVVMDLSIGEVNGGEATKMLVAKGIPAAAMPMIFERYWTVRGNAPKGGTGLGLAIARGIVEALGGRLWAESEEVQGSTFRFTLRIAA